MLEFENEQTSLFLGLNPPKHLLPYANEIVLIISESQELTDFNNATISKLFYASPSNAVDLILFPLSISIKQQESQSINKVSIYEVTSFQFKREYAPINIPKFTNIEIVFSSFPVACHFTITIDITHFLLTPPWPIPSPNEKGGGELMSN